MEGECGLFKYSQEILSKRVYKKFPWFWNEVHGIFLLTDYKIGIPDFFWNVMIQNLFIILYNPSKTQIHSKIKKKALSFEIY